MFAFQSRKAIKGADWFKGGCSCQTAPSRRSFSATVTPADLEKNLQLETLGVQHNTL